MPTKEESGVWKIIATSLISAALVFFTTLAINSTKSVEPEPKALTSDVVYVKEAIRMIFENETMILMYLKLILKKEGIPLE